jgi:hypothetical protein
MQAAVAPGARMVEDYVSVGGYSAEDALLPRDSVAERTLGASYCAGRRDGRYFRVSR